MPLQLAKMPFTKNKSLLIIAMIVGVVFVTKANAQQTSNKVVAVVNADPITEKNLSDACVQRYGKDVLDNMINRYLILQACKKKNVEVTQTEVNEEIHRLASKWKLTTEAYLRLLKDRRDISPDQYSREVIWPMLALRRLVSQDVEPTQEEFTKAYIARYGESVKCRMIIVRDKDKASQLHKQAVGNPASFESLAKQYSEDESSASIGGLIPPIRRHTGDSRLENAAFGLKSGEISAPMQLGDEWVFLQAVRVLPATPPPPQSLPMVKEQISDQIRNEKMPIAAGALFKKLQADAKVVKVLGDPAQEQQYPGAAALVNGQQLTIAQVSKECVKRHGSEVLQGEINRKLLHQALRAKKRRVEDADIKAEVARAAVNYGFVTSDGAPDMSGWIKSVASDGKTTEKIYLSDSVWPSVALKKLVETDIVISDEDMQRGYESSFGPRVEVLAIVLSDQKTAEEVWKMARGNPNERFFGQLAEQYSTEPVSASNRGKVPPIRKYGGQESIEREAFAMKPGELSGIIAAGDSYIILKCQGHTTPVVDNLEDVKSELVRDIKEKKLAQAMANEFDRLKDAAEIDNFYDVAKKSAVIAAQPNSTQTR